MVEIPLPDDDPVVMAIVFHSMHMNYDFDSAARSTSALMVDFALVCDKYDCTRTLWPICQTALTSVLSNHEFGDFNNEPAGVGGALVAAAIKRVDDMIIDFACSMLSLFKRKIECSPKGNALAPVLGIDVFGKSKPFET